MTINYVYGSINTFLFIINIQSKAEYTLIEVVCINTKKIIIYLKPNLLLLNSSIRYASISNGY